MKIKERCFEEALNLSALARARLKLPTSYGKKTSTRRLRN